MAKHPYAGIKCEGCLKPLYNDHAYPIWCEECIQELKALAALEALNRQILEGMSMLVETPREKARRLSRGRLEEINGQK